MRFPAGFMFQLSEKEVEVMVSQKAIPSKQHLGGSGKNGSRSPKWTSEQ
jgi:hypothetical protein